MKIKAIQDASLAYLALFGGYLNLRLIFVWVYISFVAHFIQEGKSLQKKLSTDRQTDLPIEM